MKYYQTTELAGVTFNEAIAKVTKALNAEGFGLLTDIDIQETMKKKIGAELYKYRILGACNPGIAFRAIQEEDKIGALLPCNIIVQEKNEGKVEVSAIDPLVSMSTVDNPGLKKIAREVSEKLKRVIGGL